MSKIKTSERKTPRLIWLGGLIFAITILGIAALLSSEDSKKESLSNASKFGVKQSACEILNPIDAYNLLGIVNQKEINATSGDTPKDLKTTRCTYTPAEPRPEIVGFAASLVVRAPLNQGAVDDNKEAFASQNTAKFQKVKGYGDAAFWNSNAGEL